MILVVRIANVDDHEAMDIQTEMYPVFERFGILKVFVFYSSREPFIEVDLVKEEVAIKGKALITVQGYTLKPTAELAMALKAATGIEVRVL